MVFIPIFKTIFDNVTKPSCPSLSVYLGALKRTQ